MVRFLLFVAGAGSLVTGCFYVDPINRRPTVMSVDRVCDAAEPGPCDPVLAKNDVHHGDRVMLKAVFSDPDGDMNDAVLTWQIRACDMDGHLCDDAIKDPAFTVPSTLQQSGGPVQSVFVHLIIEDGRGASAAADPTIRVLDGPTLVLSRSARSLTVGAPIDLFAMYGDPDEGPPGTPPSKVMVKWTATAPDGQIFPSLIDLEVPQNPADPGHVTQGERLVPPQAGTWNVGVVATDSHGKTNPQALQLAVVPDHPPCLAQWQPIAPPDGATLPITEPTRFAVPLVDDDLDPYPPVPGQPLFGTTAFEWSILPPGAPVRRRLDGATGNAIDFDPSAFVLGDIVELRVEVFDRNHVAVACADADPGCSASPGCPRRQTWRVEIR